MRDTIPTNSRRSFRSRLADWLDQCLIGVAVAAVISLLLEVGRFDLPTGFQSALHLIDFGIVVFVILSMLMHLVLAPNRWRHLRVHWPEFLLLGFFLSLLLLRTWFIDHQTFSGYPSWMQRVLLVSIPLVAKSYLAIVQTYITAHLILQGIRNSSRIAYLNLKPAQILLLSFLLVIAIGTFLLMTPRALSKPAASSSTQTVLDALFTATSATCVTGLIVQDPGTHFSLFGQGVILVLIQIGGLGLMTMTAFFALMLGQGMGIRERLLIGDILSAKTLGQISHLIVSILMLTFTFELLGALALYVTWDELASISTHSQRMYYALFHAVSAFCNAGFSLFPDSLMQYQASASVNLIVTSLIIVGGLGFTVNANLLRYTVYGRLLRQQERLSLHTKLVLVMTPLLIGVGMVLFLFPEWNHGLAGMGWGDKLLASYFQSVTTRTAGFNTVEMTNLLPATYFLMMLLMFIGASPGSTGGGIKTSTFATLMGSLWATLRGKEQVEMFKRTIPEPVVHKALAITVTSLLVLSLFGLVLLWTEQAPPMHILFEMLSAFGTVGLSAGLTPNLTWVGKCMIIFMMVIGRIGPLTLALAIGQRQGTGSYRYADEQVMIG